MAAEKLTNNQKHYNAKVNNKLWRDKKKSQAEKKRKNKVNKKQI